MSVAIVVVSFNRKDLLRECLTSVIPQSEPDDEVIVVDNGSTDGAPDMVREEFPLVTLFETGRNLGGSGGFAWGVELAIAKGHDWAWLMDDDANPTSGSLTALREVSNAAKPEPGIIASLVRGLDESQQNPGQVAAIDPDAENQIAAQRIGGIAITHATFVAVLINLHYARALALPYTDFFIWFDDVEYTRRLARSSIGILVPSSVVRHPVKPPTRDLGGRLFYYVRNSLWLSKLDTRGGIRNFLPLKAVYLAIYALKTLPHTKNKSIWARSLLMGLKQGLLDRPHTDMPGDLLRSKNRISPEQPGVK